MLRNSLNTILSADFVFLIETRAFLAVLVSLQGLRKKMVRKINKQSAVNSSEICSSDPK